MLPYFLNPCVLFGGELWKILVNNLGYVCSSNFQILVYQSQIKWQYVEAEFLKFKAAN
jgi:hypothetical protein